jgi:chromosome segregation ATPase
MGKTKSHSKPATLDSLAKLIMGTSASADKNFAAIAEDIADIKSTMATKADVHAIVREELAPIRAELKSIRGDLNDLIEKFENVSGFRKEIDHALERIATIEKRLGLDKKIAA